MCHVISIFSECSRCNGNTVWLELREKGRQYEMMGPDPYLCLRWGFWLLIWVKPLQYHSRDMTQSACCFNKIIVAALTAVSWKATVVEGRSVRRLFNNAGKTWWGLGWDSGQLLYTSVDRTSLSWWIKCGSQGFFQGSGSQSVVIKSTKYPLHWGTC